MPWRRMLGYAWVSPVTGGALSFVLLGVITGGQRSPS